MVTASNRLTTEESSEALTKEDISLTPMAMPMLSGPGSIGVVMGMALMGLSIPVPAQTKAVAKSSVPRASDGKPDLSGVWQAVSEANWDLEGHSAAPGPMWQLGAEFSVPPGLGIVEGGPIPYKPEALQKKKANFANRMNLDPEIKCYLPGVPRAMYMPYPFQIVQSPKNILMAYEYASANRVVNMEKPTEAPVDSWMGWSNGKWDGDTLVIDSVGFNGRVWLDQLGKPSTEALHVTTRLTRKDFGHLTIQATIDDPKAYSKPWTTAAVEVALVPDTELMEFICLENEKDTRRK
jgi:hypothetical protein